MFKILLQSLVMSCNLCYGYTAMAILATQVGRLGDNNSTFERQK